MHGKVYRNDLYRRAEIGAKNLNSVICNAFAILTFVVSTGLAVKTCPTLLKTAVFVQFVGKSGLVYQLRKTGILASRHKIGRDGFLPNALLRVCFTPLFRKPRCPTLTWKFRNGYVKSVEKKVTRITPTAI